MKSSERAQTNVHFTLKKNVHGYMFLEQHVLVNLPQVPEDVTDQTTLPSRTPQYIEPWGLYSFFQ